MIGGFLNVFRVPEIRTKLLITIGFLLVGGIVAASRFSLPATVNLLLLVGQALHRLPCGPRAAAHTPRGTGGGAS